MATARANTQPSIAQAISRVPGLSSQNVPVKAGSTTTWLEAGLINLTLPPFSADDTGVALADTALDDAIDAAYEECFAIWVPKGTYRLSRQHNMGQKRNFSHPNSNVGGASNRKHATQIIGDASGGTMPRFVFDDGSLGSTETTRIGFNFAFDYHTTAWVGTETGDSQLYACLLRGVEVDLGNNPDAIGVSMAGAQMCCLEDVKVVGTDFWCGFWGLPGSGGSACNLTVIGGDYAVVQRHYRPSPYASGCHFEDQAIAVLRVLDAREGVHLVGCEIINPGVAAIQISKNFLNASITDSIVTMSGNQPVIQSEVNNTSWAVNNTYTNSEVVASGGNTTALNASPGGGYTKVNGYWGAPASSLTGTLENVATPPTDLIGKHRWHIGSQPHFPTHDVVELKDYYTFGDVGNSAPVGTAALNTALAAAQNVGLPLFIGRGYCKIDAPIDIPENVSVIGGSFLNTTIIQDVVNWLPTTREFMWRTPDADSAHLFRDLSLLVFTSTENYRSKLALCHFRSSRVHYHCFHPQILDPWGQFYPGDPDTRRWEQQVVLDSGESGGWRHADAFDFHNGGGGALLPHYCWSAENKGSQPLCKYMLNTESFTYDDGVQLYIENSENITVIVTKFEATVRGIDLYHWRNVRNVSTIAGSGNYKPDEPGGLAFIDIDGASDDYQLGLFERKGTDSGNNPMLRVGGATIVPGTADEIHHYRNGSPLLFGEQAVPDFPYSPLTIPPLPAGTIQWAAGETTKTLIINVSGDTDVETDEPFTVTLLNPAPGTIGTATAVGTIRDDD